MKPTSIARGSQEPVVDPVLEKPLLRLHASMNIESLWNAAQHLIEAVIPVCFMGMTLQHSSELPTMVKWTRSIPGVLPASDPFGVFFAAQPGTRFVRMSEIFPHSSELSESDFYCKYMEPLGCVHATGLFFWRRRRLLCVIAIMRTAAQGELSLPEMKLLRQLYPQFHTALLRLGSMEREHSVRVVLEEILNRLPLPAILLRWNLKAVYQNGAAREFCVLWERGPGQARVMKTGAAVPGEILERCNTLKEQWGQLQRKGVLMPGSQREIVHHPKWPFLRVTITLKSLSSVGIARPHFLIECEDLRSVEEPQRRGADAGLSHLVRLTGREQQLVRLVCNGRSNQEIADEAGMSLQTVKNHLHTIFHKLEVTSRSRLMALMREQR